MSKKANTWTLLRAPKMTSQWQWEVVGDFSSKEIALKAAQLCVGRYMIYHRHAGEVDLWKLTVPDPVQLRLFT